MDYVHILKSILCESKIAQDILAKVLVLADYHQGNYFCKEIEYIERPFKNSLSCKIPLQIASSSADKRHGLKAIKITLLDFDNQKAKYWTIQQPPIYKMERLYKKFIQKHKSEYLRLKSPFIGLGKPHCIHFSKIGILCATNGFFTIYLDIANNYAYLGPEKFLDSVPYHYSKQGGLSPDGKRFYFVKWPLIDWAELIKGNRTTVECTIGFTDLQSFEEQKLLEFNYQDEIHEITCSPDEKHLVCGTFKQDFLCPYPRLPFALNKRGYRKAHHKGGIKLQSLVTINIKERNIWFTKIPYPTIGHFVFDPINPNYFYVSAHNLFYHQLTTYINGNGYIVKLRILDSHTEIVSTFGEAELYRVFQHDAFKYQNKVFIAVVSYCNVLYIIDSDTMQLYRKVPLGKKLILDFKYGCHMSSDDPDVCFTANASYDGRYIIVGNQKTFFAYDMEKDSLFSYRDVLPPNDGIGIGHTRSYNR